MRRLANLACGFILSILVGMGQRLSTEQYEQQRKGKRQHPYQVMTGFWSGHHCSLSLPRSPFRRKDLFAVSYYYSFKLGIYL